MAGKVKITYCVIWNYKPRATSLAAKIKDKFGLESELIEGGRGIFDVENPDGNLIFSKHREGRFPETAEILAKLN